MLDERFIIKMKEYLGEEGFLEYENELSRSSKRALRVNSIKKPSSIPFDLTPVPYCENGYYFEYDKIGSHPLHHAGGVYVQEPAAMVPIASLEIKPDFRILDTCAAPGGKSTQAAAFLGENGFIISNEINPSRKKVLSGNIERLGLLNAVVTSCDIETLTEDFGYFFDLVIVDAPCSGEGMFRKEPDALKDWSPENVSLCAERQTEIIRSASRAVAGGGYLLYSTCTFSREENEDIVNSFLEDNPDFSLVAPKEEILPYTLPSLTDVRMRRFYPHIASGEGQFTAIMKREGSEKREFVGSSGLSPLSREERKITEDFLGDILLDFDSEKLFKFKESIVYIDPRVPVPEKISYSASVTLGEISKGYFKPHHNLFSALGKSFKRKINLALDDVRLSAYLRGESFEEACENGYVAVLVEGVALGGGKAVNGQIKNHYPKGLRIQH